MSLVSPWFLVQQKLNQIPPTLTFRNVCVSVTKIDRLFLGIKGGSWLWCGKLFQDWWRRTWVGGETSGVNTKLSRWERPPYYRHAELISPGSSSGEVWFWQEHDRRHWNQQGALGQLCLLLWEPWWLHGLLDADKSRIQWVLLMGLKVTLALAFGFSSLSEVMCVLVTGLLTFEVEMQTHRE